MHVSDNLGQVLAKLPQFLELDDALHIAEPLTISAHAVSDKEGGSGYKHPWIETDARNALTTSGMFEASGNVFWLHPLPKPEMPIEEISLAAVYRLAEALFSKQAVWQANVKLTGNSTGLMDRLIWPSSCPMICCVNSVAEGAKAFFQQGLIPIAGLGILHAFYLAMCDAIVANDKAHIRLLWQMARSVTLQVEQFVTLCYIFASSFWHRFPH